MYENIKVIIDGQIILPKSEALIIPGNQSGLMTRGQVALLVEEGGSLIAREAKRAVEASKPKIGDCFTTLPGRLRKRGVKRLYHAVIKRYPSDLTGITEVTLAINNSVDKAVKDGNKSITICGIGAGPGELDITIVSRIILSTCEKYPDILFRIIDNNIEFIKEMKKLIGDNNAN